MGAKGLSTNGNRVRGPDELSIAKNLEVNAKEVSTDGNKECNEKRIKEVMKQFEGEIQQLPPPYSAVKVDGVRSYKAARRGVELELKARDVKIKRIEFTRLTDTGFEMQITCSHGTYIRSLAYDIGCELGTGAHLGKLIRTRVGEYTLDQAIDLETFISKINSRQFVPPVNDGEICKGLQWK